MNESTLENMGYRETGEVLKVHRGCSGLVWLAALTEAVAAGVLGPCSDRRYKWHWCPVARGSLGSAG